MISDRHHIVMTSEINCIGQTSGDRRFFTEFIEIYRGLPSLWKIKSEVYRNRRLKFEAYNKLVAKLRENDPEATRECVKKVINNLRTKHRKELKRINAECKQVEGVKPKLWCYHLLEFLRNDQEPSPSDYNEVITEETMPIDVVISIPEKKGNSKSAIFVEHKQFDEAVYLGVRWALKCNQLNYDQKVLAKKAINDLIFEGKLKTLEKDSIKINNSIASAVHTNNENVYQGDEYVEDNKHKRKRSLWMKECYKRRSEVDKNLSPILLNPSLIECESIFRMKCSTFEELLHLVTPYIIKSNTVMRESIPPTQRLAATLRFLISGRTLEELKDVTNIAPQTLGHIVIETCEALMVVLKDFMKTPQTTGEWLEISNQFESKWNFPHCMGGIGGVHIQIPKPRNTGVDSHKHNHKKKCSAVLLGVVDADYKFTLVDVGPSIECSANTTHTTHYSERIFHKIQGIPEPGIITNTLDILPYIFVTDCIFPLSDNVMKPYTRRFVTKDQLIYNYRLGRVHRVVQNAIGIMASQFRILLNTIRYNCTEKSLKVILTCCFLHNYLMSKDQTTYACNGFDMEDTSTGTIYNASWRLDNNQLMQIQDNQSNNYPYSSRIIRDKYCEYFNNIGSLPWQNLFIPTALDNNEVDSSATSQDEQDKFYIHDTTLQDYTYWEAFK